MDKSAEFLDLYRRLENAAERITGGDSKRQNAVMRLAGHRRFSQWSNNFDTFREIRNFLSHESKVDGKYAIVPEDRVLEKLRQAVAAAESPAQLKSIMTPLEKLLKCEASDSALFVMREMRRLGISHVPITENGIVKGVFSSLSVFDAVSDKVIFDADATVGMFSKYTAFSGETYAFLPATATVYEAEKMFDENKTVREKLRLIMVTEDGTRYSFLKGVVSPYDIMNV